MSRLLKFIVHLGIIGIIVCILGLSVPQFFGIKTTVIDGSYTDTNMLMGSVTYSKEIDPSLLQLGDDIVVENGNSVRRYQVIQVNLAEENCMVKDPVFAGDYSQTVSLKSGAWKTLFAVEYVGYLLVATQSKEGMIILLIGVLVLIILYIIAELWRKTPADLEEEEEVIPVKSKKELKKEEKAREEKRRQEEEEILEKKAPRRRKKKADVIRTGGFIDEIAAEDQEIEQKLRMIEKQQAGSQGAASAKDAKKDGRKDSPMSTQEIRDEMKKEMSVAASEAHEELKKEVTAAGIELSEEKLGGDTRDLNVEFEDDFADSLHKTAEAPEETVGQDLMVPNFSAEDLAKEVKESGEEPDIMRDEVSKVVFFDYSDILTDRENGKKD